MKGPLNLSGHLSMKIILLDPNLVRTFFGNDFLILITVRTLGNNYFLVHTKLGYLRYRIIHNKRKKSSEEFILNLLFKNKNVWQIKDTKICMKQKFLLQFITFFLFSPLITIYQSFLLEALNQVNSHDFTDHDVTGFEPFRGTLSEEKKSE